MRRPRYKGSHPRRPEDKYKELDPTKYPEDIAHIEAKGRTPLGTHKPIMVQEILSALQPKEGEKGVDLTLGYGGHSLEILKKIGPTGTLLGLDQDPIELKRTAERLASLDYDAQVFVPIHSNFRHLRMVTGESGPQKFDFVLGDLGLSSMQIDRPERGFSLKHDTTLDFRMDPTRGQPALQVLHEISLDELKRILVDFADEPFPHRLAEGILRGTKAGEIKTTKDFKRCIIDTLSKIKKYPTEPDKAVPRVFQALRIYINEELTSLQELLTQLPELLNPGARVAFLTFHSGEDRLVKKFFKQGLGAQIFSEIHGPIKADEEEVQKNRRARSAKLRWGIFG